MRTVKLTDRLSVPLLTIRDMMEIGEAAWQAERVSLLADLETSGASGDARLSALREHSLRKGTALVLLIATMRLDVASDIVRRAAFRAGVDADDVLGRMSPAEIVEAAQALCGYEKADEGKASGPAATA